MSLTPLLLLVALVQLRRLLRRERGTGRLEVLMFDPMLDSLESNAAPDTLREWTPLMDADGPRECNCSVTRLSLLARDVRDD